MEVLLEFGDGNLAEVEDAGGERSIGVAIEEGVAEVLLTACTATGDDGDGEVVGEFAQGLVGIAFLHAVVVHRGEEDFSSATLLSLVGPLEESSLGTFAATLEIAVPAIFVETGIDGADAHLGAETAGNLVDEFRMADGSAVDAYLVGSSI